MLGTFRNKRGGVLIWALMAALVVGLAGFGIGAGGGIVSQNVARVGSEPISTDEYVRAMQQELRALTQQIGRQLPMAEARQYGVDRMVLARLVNDAALDAEAARLGLSTGDEAVRQQIVGTPAFKGADGAFDRETYAFALERIGLRPDEFETLIRQEFDPQPDRLGRAGRRRPARDRGADRARLPRREAQLRLDPARRKPPARADPRPDRAPSSRPSTRRTPPTATPGPRPGRSPTPASPPRRSPKPSSSPTTSCAPPTTPRSPASRPRSAGRSTGSASATARGGRGRQGAARRRRDRLRRPRRRARPEARGRRPGPRRRRRALSASPRGGVRRRGPRHRRPGRHPPRPVALPDQRHPRRRRRRPSSRPGPSSPASARSTRRSGRSPRTPCTSRT